MATTGYELVKESIFKRRQERKTISCHGSTAK